MIPVTVVTGFLGSGKTTLLRRALSDPRFAATALIVNEFGEIGFDDALVQASTDTLIQLSTGCLCCRIRSDLVTTLLDLEARRADGSVPPYARVVIETSGLADPAPILHALMTDGGVAEGHRLAGLVTTVDASTGSPTLDRHVEARRQVALADRIVVTKTDIAPDSEPLRTRVAGINPIASLTVGDRGAVSPDWLLVGDEGASHTLDLSRWIATSRVDFEGPLGHARHSDGIETFTIVREDPVPAVALTLFLQALAEHGGADLLRLKGLACIAESPETPAAVHGVQHVFHPPEWLEAWPTEDHRTRLVIIGRGIPRAWPGRLLDVLVEEVRRASRSRR